MKNYTSIFLFISFITFLIFGAAIVSAQQEDEISFSDFEEEGILVADVNIRNAFIAPLGNGSFGIRFDLVNRLSVQPDIRYSLELVDESGAILDFYSSPESFVLKDGESLPVSFTYTPPSFAKGDMRVILVSENSSGLMLASAIAGQISLLGSDEYAKFEQCTLLVDEENFFLGQGVDVDSDENLNLSCLLTNTFKTSQTVKFSFETYWRTRSGDLVSTVDGDSISLSPGVSRAVNVSIPKESIPQAYNVKIDLKQEGNSVSAPVFVHYVLRGASGTISNIRLDKDSYRKGDKAVVSLLWASAADSFAGTRGEATELENVAITVEIKDGEGNFCGSASKVLGEDSVVEIPVSIERSCVNPAVSSSLSSNGAVLDEKSFEVVSNPADNLTKILAFVVSILLLVLIIAGFFIFRTLRKKNNIDNSSSGVNFPSDNDFTKPLVMLAVFIGVATFSFFAFSSSASAATYFYGSESKFQHVIVNVSLPKDVYEPGEKIEPLFSVATHKCANKLYYAEIRYKLSNEQARWFPNDDYARSLGPTWPPMTASQLELLREPYTGTVYIAQPGNINANLQSYIDSMAPYLIRTRPWDNGGEIKYDYIKDGKNLRMTIYNGNYVVYVESLGKIPKSFKPDGSVASYYDSLVAPKIFFGLVFPYSPGNTFFMDISGFASQNEGPNKVTIEGALRWPLGGKTFKIEIPYSVVAPTQETPAPTLTLSANPQIIAPGENSTLTWASENADRCVSLTGDWNPTPPALSGNSVVSPKAQVTYYTMMCLQTINSVTKSVHRTVTIDLENPEDVNPDDGDGNGGGSNGGDGSGNNGNGTGNNGGGTGGGEFGDFACVVNPLSPVAGESFQVSLNGTLPSGTSFLWQDAVTNVVLGSGTQSPTSIVYQSAGTKKVKVTLSAEGFTSKTIVCEGNILIRPKTSIEEI